MLDKIKSAFAVTLTTVLIWFTADQQVSEEGRFSISVRLASTGANRYVAFAEPPFQPTFDVVVAGRRRHLNEFAQLLSSKPVFEAVVDESKESSPQPQSILSREVLGMINEVSAASIRIRNVDPPAVNIRIDDYLTVSNIRVTCEYGDLQVSAKPTPAKLSVRLPRFAAERLRADPVARAEAEARIRAARKPDGSFQIRLPVTFDALKELDPDMKIEVLPSAEIQVSGQIEALTATRRKGPLQITWSIPQQVQEDFKIVIDPSVNLRPDIEITGPKQSIDQLDAREIRAFVDVMAADTEKPQTPVRRTVQFVLPPGFSLAAGSPPYEVIFQLEPRGPSGSPAPAQ